MSSACMIARYVERLAQYMPAQFTQATDKD